MFTKLEIVNMIEGNVTELNSSLSDRIDNLPITNSSFNQTLTDTLYSGIEWGYNMSDGSYNETYDTWSYNMSDGSYNETYDTWSYNMSDGSYNETYDTWSYNQTESANAYTDAQDVIYNDSMKDYVDVQVSGVEGDNSSWNESYADTLYSGIEWGYNQSDGSYNETYDTWSYNQTYSGSTYNETYAGSINNASYLTTYNETYDTWSYNQTEEANEYTNLVNNSLVTFIDGVYLKIIDMFTN